MFKIFFFSLGTGTFFNSSVCFVMGWGGVEDYFMFHGGEVNSGFPTVGRGGATFHFFLFKVWRVQLEDAARGGGPQENFEVH